MSRYRRAVSGTTCFFTVVAHRRRPILCDPPVRLALRSAIQAVRAMRPFTIDSWVLLPDHLHCIWSLPEDDRDFSSRWSQIKHRVSYACRGQYDGVAIPSTKKRRREASIWQRRFWDHMIRDEADLERHLDYIHFNPVRHGLVQRPCDWPYSTFHRYVRGGVYPWDWGGAPGLYELDFE